MPVQLSVSYMQAEGWKRCWTAYPTFDGGDHDLIQTGCEEHAIVQATDCISGTGHFPPTSIQSPGLILEVGSLTGQQKTPNRILHVKPSSALHCP